MGHKKLNFSLEDLTFSDGSMCSPNNDDNDGGGAEDAKFSSKVRFVCPINASDSYFIIRDSLIQRCRIQFEIATPRACQTKKKRHLPCFAYSPLSKSHINFDSLRSSSAFDVTTQEGRRPFVFKICEFLNEEGTGALTKVSKDGPFLSAGKASHDFQVSSDGKKEEYLLFYRDGDPCPGDLSKNLSTVIRLSCTNVENSPNISVMANDDCSFDVNFKTSVACSQQSLCSSMKGNGYYDFSSLKTVSASIRNEKQESFFYQLIISSCREIEDDLV